VYILLAYSSACTHITVHNMLANANSMANAGPGTETSQFYILFAEAAWLNDKHIVIGRMLAGEDVLQQ
jgi:cyclophilin family peptidyl-prolyl cis-trans isomerase